MKNNNEKSTEVKPAKKTSLKIKEFLPVVLFSVLLVGVGYAVSEITSKDINSTVTVVGVANSEKANKVAYFTADIVKKNDDKQIAVAELNESSAAAIEAIKTMGIESKDIKTKFYNVYQNSEWDPVTQESKLTDWSASISVEIKLDDVERAGELGNLLATLDTTYITGPNFSLDPEEAKNNDLVKGAMEDARAKAENIALLSNRKLGKVINVDETSYSEPAAPTYKYAQGLGGAGEESLSLDAGTSSVQKTLLVTFELK